ncbi:MAG: alpha/beta hydrolase [Planctomycetes bacterium]|nr:alpha/beta hydrolase [Planctomycetota bacterium]
MAGAGLPAPRSIKIRGSAGDVPATIVDVGPSNAGVPVFVFLHGLVGLNEHWENVVRRFSTTTRCVMLQIPLLDLSGDDCSIQGVTALTSRFLQDYFPAELPVALVGNSFGGHVALRLAIEHPDQVCALVLAGSSGLIEKSMVSDVQIRPSREWLRRKIGELFYDRKHMREADIERAYKELSSRSGARAMVKLSRSARRNHLGDKLGRIKAPTLLIWGREDIVTPPEAAEGFRASIPGSRIVWFDRCGHAPMIECPDQFAGALADFVPEIRRP